MTTLLVLLLLLLPACSLACPAHVPDSLSTPPTPSTSFDASTPLIVLPPSTRFHLRLKANPTTGYGWSLHPSSDIVAAVDASGAAVCSVQACAFEQHRHAPGMVGVGGEEVWELETGTEEGEARLALQYRRPWMGDLTEPSATWTVQVSSAADGRGL